VGGSNSAGEALQGEHVSRSASEPVSASLRKVGVASLPKNDEAWNRRWSNG